jgi:uncharacterized repeat protein (TIGR03803 family)
MSQVRIYLMLVFAVTGYIASAQTLQTLVSFNSANGANPYAGLALGPDGNFYGTTYGGGNGYGTIFQVTTSGTLTTLASFGNTNGAYPYAGLTLGPDGNFYGTTYGGGNGYGTVFQVTTNGTLTTLVSFNSANGANPYAGLTLGLDGNFYGTTYRGGNGYGTVFQVTTNGTLTTLANFANSNGANPYAGLSVGIDGNFYGTTLNGGSIFSSFTSGAGTVYKVTPAGQLTSLVNMTANTGQSPYAGLTLGPDSNFYGVCSMSSGGTFFKVTTNGTLTMLNNAFFFQHSYLPYATLMLGPDGNFYGTTRGLGSDGDYGSVFETTTNGSFTELAYWSNTTTNGAYPYAGLSLGNDGNLYGTTSSGGSGFGTVFRILLLPVPPFINTAPQSRTNNAGTNITFVINAKSFTPLAYQWQKNGTNLVDGGNILGSTSNILAVTSISDTDAAIYSVIVNNANFTVTNSATLTVIDQPIILAQPTNLLVLAGTTATFSTTLTGSVPFFRYQWRLNGTNLLNANNPIYTISGVATNKAGFYSIVVTNMAGIAVSSNAALTVVLSPASRTNYAGSTTTFTATAFTPEVLNFQWQKAGTNLIDGGNIAGSTNNSLTIANVSDADAATYNLVVSDATGSVTTSNAVLIVNDFPFIVTQPQSQTVLVGSNVTFSATAYGAPPYVFQWYFNGAPVGSPTTGTNYSYYTLSDVGTNRSGNYTVQVVNGAGSVMSSNALLTVVTLPTITTQPVNRTNGATTTATFSVVASSVSTMSYQWQQNGTNLVNGGKFSGVTTNTLTITGVSSNEAAIYSVAVTNLAGSVTSSNATLTVIYPPVITSQPLGQRLLLGSNVSFSVTVSGTAPFNYQWRFNAGNLLNATNATYAIQAIVATNTGNYSVVVTNLAGSVTSSNALLTVLVPPTLALQLWAGYPLLNLNGMLSNNFVVQYNTDLTGTNWMNLLSLTNLSASPYLFLDPAGIVPPARFYRAVMQ